MRRQLSGRFLQALTILTMLTGYTYCTYSTYYYLVLTLLTVLTTTWYLLYLLYLLLLGTYSTYSTYYYLVLTCSPYSTHSSGRVLQVGHDLIHAEILRSRPKAQVQSLRGSVTLGTAKEPLQTITYYSLLST